VIRSVLFIEPRGGDHDAVVAFYRRSRVLEDAATVDGFVSSEVHVPLEGGAVLVTALWRDAEAYQRWVDHPARARSAEGLAEVVEGDFDAGVRGTLYEIVVEQPADRERAR
jgi:heme-degrading monooxygenase HmoA